MQSDPPARMQELEPGRLNDEQRAFLARWTTGAFKDGDQNPVLLTLAHHPQLADLFSQLNIHLLLTSSLPVKQRQIAIMRTAWICKATYMWSSHLATSVSFGLSPDMFAPLQVGAQDPYFSPFEKTVIAATEQLVAAQKIEDESWAALRAEWNEQQMLDFMFTVGIYVTVAGVMRSTGVQRRPDLLALAAKYGAP
jgi:4-carboxymuconolactone decarboxylase